MICSFAKKFEPRERGDLHLFIHLHALSCRQIIGCPASKYSSFEYELLSNFLFHPPSVRLLVDRKMAQNNVNRRRRHRRTIKAKFAVVVVVDKSKVESLSQSFYLAMI